MYNSRNIHIPNPCASSMISPMSRNLILKENSRKLEWCPRNGCLMCCSVKG
jgi:hypothetical protein